MRLWDGESPGIPKKVRIQAEAAPPTVVHALTDRAGDFEVELPVGHYRVEVAQRGWESRTNAVVAVREGNVARVELTAPPVTGRVVAAGPGKARPAGRGTRQGAWLTYGVADGLPRSMIVAILQDQQGALWLGTGGGGLVRFDGSSFTTYTQADGLASDDMSELVEDGRGDLWVTYWVNRLKGRHALRPNREPVRHVQLGGRAGVGRHRDRDAGSGRSRVAGHARRAHLLGRGAASVRSPGRAGWSAGPDHSDACTAGRVVGFGEGSCRPWRFTLGRGTG